MTQQIPALVERDLDRLKFGDLVIRRRRPGMLSLERVLIRDELTDPVN